MPIFNGGRIGSNNVPFTGTKSDDPNYSSVSLLLNGNESSSDPNYSNVSLLLNGNGTNGSTTFIDSSPSQLVLESQNSTNAYISTAESVFGGSSLYFSGGVGGFLKSAANSDFWFGTEDFTIEAFVRRINHGNLYQTIASVFSDNAAAGNPVGSGWTLYLTTDFKFACGIFSDNSSQNVVSLISPTVVQVGVWYHVAVVRNGTSFVLYVDGESVSTSTSTSDFNVAPNPLTLLNIGSYGNRAYPNSFGGYIDDLRITKGVARYTSNFNPPTAELPDPSDPDFDSVSLLLHGDGNNGSTTFIDSSNNSHTVTANGDAEISTTQSKFGGASMYFDGSGDYLSIPDSDQFEIGSGDFTFEAWIYLTGYSAAYQGQYYVAEIICKDSGSTGRGFTFYVLGTSTSWTNLRVGLFSSNTNLLVTSATTSFNLNTWYHVAGVRNGTSLRLYKNGVDVGGGTNATTVQNTTTAVTVGSENPYFIATGNAYYFPGYIDDLRITKGVARYTSNFTPPTAPLPDETIVTNGLALHLDAGNSASYPGTGTTWTDLSGNENDGTLTNGPTYDSSDGGSIVFDGDNDFIDLGTIGVSHPLQLDNGFTISWWGIQSGSGDLFQRIIDKSNGGLGLNGWAIYPLGQGEPDTQLTLNYDGNEGGINSSTRLSSTSWQNWSITWSSSSNQWIWYLNGSVDNSGYKTYNVPTFQTNARIGSWNHSTQREYKGKISSVLIYTRPLTASEIAKNYNALRDRYGL